MPALSVGVSSLALDFRYVQGAESVLNIALEQVVAARPLFSAIQGNTGWL